MPFKHVPDSWTFQGMGETDMFRWRTELEQRLDALRDQTAAIIFKGKRSIKDGQKMAQEALADCPHAVRAWRSTAASWSCKQSRRWPQ